MSISASIGWSNSRESWLERLGIALLAAMAFALVWWGSSLELTAQTALWLGWLLLVAMVLRRGWLKLFGPVLFYDMMRIGRRSRYVFLRTAYVIFLYLMLGWVFWTWTEYSFALDQIQTRQMAYFAESFFYMFITVQFMTTVVLTPAYVAGSIADEKSRRTLEFLLATDLRNREIIFGKLLSRLANLTLIVLAGLPVLSFMQFFGGVDPDLLLAAFAGQAVTMLSMAGISILFSVYARKPRDAIVMTYLTVIAYPALASFFWGLVEGTRLLGWSLPVWGLVEFTLKDVVDVVNAGNLFYVIPAMGLSTGRPDYSLLPALMRNYLLFHGVVALVCVSWSVWRLRTAALSERFAKAQKLNVFTQVVGRPPVGADPMRWKEIHVESGTRAGWLGRILIFVLMACSFIPPVIILVLFTEQIRSAWGNMPESYAWRQLRESTNVWVRSVGTIVACLLLLAVTVRAATSIGSERDRQTLDSLLTTTLSTHDILFAKWLGSVMSVRWGLLWLVLIWLVGAAMGGIHVLSIPFLFGAWLIYAGVFAALGLWFSVICKTTGRATVGSLLTAVFIGGGHWLFVGMCCCTSAIYMGGDSIHLVAFVAGQTPPFVIGLYAFQGFEFEHGVREEFGSFIACSVLGLGCWAVGGFVLAANAWHRFREKTGRIARRVTRPRPLYAPEVSGPEAIPFAEPVDDE